MFTQSWCIKGALCVFLSLSLSAPLSAQELSEEQQNIQLPRPLHTPLASYPEAARESGLEGDVTLRLSLSAEGRVLSARVVREAGHGFDEAARAAAICFRFSPAEQAGRPVPVSILYRYPFRLRDAEREGRCLEEEEWSDGEPTLLPGTLTGSLEGILLERGSRRPLRGVEVRVPGLRIRRLSDRNGRFRFNQLPVGELTFEIVDQEFKALHEAHQVREGNSNELLRLYLERQRFAGEDILGREYQLLSRRARLTDTDDANRYPLSRREIEGMAGIDGDPLQAARSLPGVGRPAFAMGPLLLRGSAAQVYLFDTPLSDPMHLMGLRSRIPAAILEGVELVSLAEASRRGGGTTLELRLREPPRAQRVGQFELNPFELGITLGGPLSPRSTLTGSLRRGLFSELSGAIAGDSQLVQHGPPIPESYDGLVRYTWRGEDDQLDTLFSFYQSDWQRTQGDSPALLSRRGALYGERVGVQAQGRWQHRYGGQLSGELTFSAAIAEDKQRLAYDQHERFTRSALELHPIFHYAIRRHQISFGFDGGRYTLDDTQDGLGPRVEGEGAIARRSPLAGLGGDQRVWYDAAFWVDSELEWNNLRLIPGVRGVYFGDTETLRAEPRLTLRYRPAFGTILKLAGGLYSERFDPRRLDARRGNLSLEPGESIRVLGGVEQRLAEKLTFDISGSWRQSEGLVQRDPDPRVRFTNDGALQVIGGELLLRHELSARFHGWLSYGYSQVELRSTPDAALRRADWEQSHLVSLTGQLYFTPRLSSSLRWGFGSPLSYSSSVGSIFDSDRGQPSALVGPVNDQLLDPHHQLDLRVDYRLLFDQANLLIYLDFKNLYHQQGRAAVDPTSWSLDETSYLKQWPFLLTLGLRGAF